MPHHPFESARSDGLHLQNAGPVCDIIDTGSPKGCRYALREPVDGQLSHNNTSLPAHLRRRSARGLLQGLAPYTTTWRGRVGLRATDAADLQPLFNARPLGYLGADVAASLVAPPALLPNGSLSQGGLTTIWLFGDTLLGRSLPLQGQRVAAGYFIHNSVALVPRSRRVQPEDVRFVWGGGQLLGPQAPRDEPCPRAVFRVPGAPVDECSDDAGAYVWVCGAYTCACGVKPGLSCFHRVSTTCLLRPIALPFPLPPPLQPTSGPSWA
jgi:hypothetical protein